jgi:hypothetical protein
LTPGAPRTTIGPGATDVSEDREAIDGTLPAEREQAFWDGVHEARRLTAEGLKKLKAEAVSRGLRDPDSGVNIDIVLAGEYPGDGKPKPVVFPDPRTTAVRGRRVALLPLWKLIELKLASGTTAPHRLKDLADVLEVIRHPRVAARDGPIAGPLGPGEVRGALAGRPGGGARLTRRWRPT